MRLYWLAVLVLNIAGCAHAVQWAPGPGITIAEFEPTKARCSLMARHGGSDFVAYGSQSYVAGASLGHAIGESARMQAEFSDCMVASGWSPVTQAVVASQNLKNGQLASLKEQRLACINDVRSNAQYDPLLPHLADAKSGEYSMIQLTDDGVPTAADSRLIAAYWDNAKTCIVKAEQGLSAVAPAWVPILQQQLSENEQVIILLVKRQISWGEADRRQKANGEAASAKLRATRI